MTSPKIQQGGRSHIRNLQTAIVWSRLEMSSQRLQQLLYCRLDKMLSHGGSLCFVSAFYLFNSIC